MSSPLSKSFLIIAVIGLTIYSFSFPNTFIWDDEQLIKENRFIKNLNNWPLSFTRLLFHDAPGRSKFYRPLQEISYAFDYRLWGLNPFGYHLTNSLLHIASALIFCLVLFQIFKNPFISFWGGAFFVAHPVHTEAVAYISGRSDSLALLFLLLSLSCYIYSLKRNRLFLIPSLFSFLLALFSRESSLIFPFVILAYNFVFLSPQISPKSKRGDKPKKLLPFFLFIILAELYLLIRLNLVTAAAPLQFYCWSQPLSMRLFTGCKIIVRYLFLLIFPSNLHMERFTPLSRSILDFPVLSSLIFVLLIIYLSSRLCRQKRTLTFFFLFFVITLFPFLNIIPLNAQMAEHWLYLPSIGFFAVLSWAAFSVKCRFASTANSWPERKLGKNFVSLILILILVIYSHLTIKQIKTWANPIIFYEYTARQAPYSNRIQLCLASAYAKKQRYSEAAGILKIITKNSPDNLKARNNLAGVLLELGELDAASAELKTLLNLNPEYLRGYLQLANLYQKRGEEEKTIKTYRKMMRLDPDSTIPYYQLGNLYYKNGQLELAMDNFKKGLAIDDKAAELHNNMGICYAELEKYIAAEAEWQEALNLDPYYQEAKYNLGLLKKPAAPDYTDLKPDYTD